MLVEGIRGVKSDPWSVLVGSRRASLSDEPRLHGSGNRQDGDTGGASDLEQSGDLLCSGPGRVDVVHDENGFSPDGTRRLDLESPLEVPSPFGSLEETLGGRVADPRDGMEVQRRLQEPCQRPGQEQGLVEFPLPETLRMEGDRQNRVECAGGEEPVETVGEQSAERGRQESLSSVLEREQRSAQV